MTDTPRLCACHCCGLIQRLPPVPRNRRPVCLRCGSSLRHGGRYRNHLAAALAGAALAFYPPAMLLPVMRLERLGHSQEDSILSGVAALLGQGYWLVGGVVLLFSVLLPPLKLLTLGLLALNARRYRHRHRALAYHTVELLGRFGMLDVMLVALLVALVKLGDLVNIHPGPGLTAFTLLVLLSLLASLAFNPALMWDDPAPNPSDHDRTHPH